MKFFKILGYIALLIIWFSWFSNAQLEIPWGATIYNTNQDQYVNANDIWNPIRDGAYTAIKSPDQNEEIGGIQWGGEKIEDHNTAKDKTFAIIKNFINYALGLLSLIALIYMIYHGVIILTAAGDDTKYKQGLKWIKFAAIALIWIGFSRIIVSSIFWVIFEVLLKPTT